MRALTIALCLLATPALADVTGTAAVIDGDTLEIHGQRIRLHGIDAPEKDNALTGQGRSKGNINREGKHIYHVPGGSGMIGPRPTRPRNSGGFAPEAEARAAGWRKSNQ